METYKLPKHLIGSETARGAVPARLTPIFRDREELSAGDSLSGQVQDALSASDALIVLCSPNAKRSAWVGKEIETFRALHPDRPILAALLEGEPTEAFPDALTVGGAEPIAADLRKGKDGWRLGQQKLIAGMTGVPLDALVQRDAQRQLRRVTAITVGALIAMLVMALLLVAALRARAEADRQRTEAEGLVEYMLTDLRDRLKGVGRLDVMTAVNERAMGYYGEGSTEAHLLRAKTLHALGEDDQNRGENKRALSRFQKAYNITSEMLDMNPDSADTIYAHAQSEYWMGSVGLINFDRAFTEPYYFRYKKLADRLGEMDPKKAEWRREQGYADGNLCSFWLQEGRDKARALEMCKSALGHMTQVDRLTNGHPKSKADLINRFAWLALAWRDNGEPKQAVLERQRQLQIASSLAAKDHRNLDWIELHVVALLSLADELLRDDETSTVQIKDLLQVATSKIDYIIKLDPDNSFRKEIKLELLKAKTKIKDRTNES